MPARLCTIVIGTPVWFKVSCNTTFQWTPDISDHSQVRESHMTTECRSRAFKSSAKRGGTSAKGDSVKRLSCGTSCNSGLIFCDCCFFFRGRRLRLSRSSAASNSSLSSPTTIGFCARRDDKGRVLVLKPDWRVVRCCFGFLSAFVSSPNSSRHLLLRSMFARRCCS